MKYLFFLVVMATGISNAAMACDVCGCAAGNQYLGLLPHPQWNFAGLQYQYNSFTSDHPSPFSGREAEHGQDYYHSIQAWGRYTIGKRYQVYAFVPYRYNQHREDSTKYTSQGIGDVTVLVNRLIVTDAGNKWKHSLQGGVGLKLPTGKYTGITDLDRQGLPNMQPGTGSWDGIVNVNYTARRNRTGINADVSYTLTTPNHDNYKYGNRLASGVMTFYSIETKTVNFMPQLGVRYEYTLHDYDNYDRKWLNEQTGGYMCFATAGVQAYYKKIGLRYTYQLPISQDYSTGYVTAKQKMETSIFFLF